MAAAVSKPAVATAVSESKGVTRIRPAIIHTKSLVAPATRPVHNPSAAGVAELVDARDLGSRGATRAGSNPVARIPWPVRKGPSRRRVASPAAGGNRLPPGYE